MFSLKKIISLCLVLFLAGSLEANNSFLAKRSFKRGLFFFNKQLYRPAAYFFKKSLKDNPNCFVAREYLIKAYEANGYSELALGEKQNLEKIDGLGFHEKEKNSYKRYYDFRLDLTDFISFKEDQNLQPLDFVLDEQDNIYLLSYSPAEILKIDFQGEKDILFRKENAKFYGIDYFKSNLLISDFKNDQVYLLDSSGKIRQTLGSSGIGEGQFLGPKGLCFDPQRNIYVVDYGNNRVQKFSPSGNFILTFNNEYGSLGQLKNPNDIIFADEKLYVADSGQQRIVIYNSQGLFLEEIVLNHFIHPEGLDAQGNLLLAADQEQGLFLYDLKDKVSCWLNIEERYRNLFSVKMDASKYIYALDPKQRALLGFSLFPAKPSNLAVNLNFIDLSQFPLVNLGVHVKDQLNSPLPSLGVSNFKLIENEEARPKFFVEKEVKEESNIALIFCLDRSLFSKTYHSQIVKIVSLLLSELKGRGDDLRIVNFNNKIWQSASYLEEGLGILNYLQERSYYPGQKIGQALYESLHLAFSTSGKRGVVLITKGQPGHQKLFNFQAKKIISLARYHNIPIYLISFQEANLFLKNIVSKTGGDFFTIKEKERVKDLPANLRKTKDGRYLLKYITSKPLLNKDEWLKINLEVEYRKKTGRVKGGYFGL